jgi:hypothetical protein
MQIVHGYYKTEVNHTSVSNHVNVRFEVFTAVIMKNAVFWDVAPCRSCVNRRFGGIFRLHLEGKKIRERGTSVKMWLQTTRGFSYPEDGGETFFRNVGSHRIYTVPHGRRLHSSAT